MISYSFTLDSELYRTQLSRFPKEMPRIGKRMMGRLLSEVKKEIKLNLKGRVLHRRSGKALKSIKFKTRPDFSARLTAGPYYMGFHEGGPTTILPSKRKYITFEVDGHWRRAKKVVLPQRKPVEPALNDWFRTDRGNKYMDEIMQEELNEVFGASSK